MPDYQTAEGMAVEPYEKEVKRLRHALKRIRRVIDKQERYSKQALCDKIEYALIKVLKC